MPPSAYDQRSLDPLIWKACAGSSVQIPAVDSRVYYFPQGHAEQASSPPDFSSVPCKKPYSLCRISAVQFLANQNTDEVFVKIELDPIVAPTAVPVPDSSFLQYPGEDGGGVVSFAKILTPSDANNGGGFSVPRFCADSIFPPLDYKADPPVQTISVRDVHGIMWEFRHIYRGTPRRHLLTTGWSKFVNNKKLVAGDSVVFIRKGSGELFVGVRRAGRSCGPTDYLRYTIPMGPPATPVAKPEENMGGGREGFSRNCKGRVPPESVVEAVRLAGMDHHFEIMHYPRAGSPDFVVRAEVVEAAISVHWLPGMRVRMAVETEDSSRMTWFQGMVSCTAVQDPGPWSGSPWRMLQVTWDEPEALQNVKSVSPWQVELVSATPQIPSPYPPTKKLRALPNPELLTDGDGGMFFSMSGFTSAMMGSLSPSLYNYNTFPAGMQGARHDPIRIPSLSNFVPSNPQQVSSDNLYRNNMPLKVNHVSTELNIGSSSQSETSSPPSQDSILNYGTEPFSNNTVCSKTTKASGGSFQLFGKTIQTEQPIDGEVAKGHKETEGTVRPLNFCLSYSQKQLHKGNDVPLQRVLAVEACTL